MFALIFENGMLTRSWYAWLALRRRVSMSAIGSVIVMGARQTFLAGVPLPGPTAKRWLPGSLGYAGELAAVGHLPDADPAETELAVDRVRPAAALTTRVRAYGELRLPGRLQDQRLFGHKDQFSLN